MGNFDLSNYKTVAERITEAKAAYPQGSFQTELLVLPPGLAEKYVAVKARFYRFENDAQPGEGVAWELVPGKTPYTKDSELQNAETSAWGRALVAAFAVDASKGIASREEVQARQSQDRPRSGPQKRIPNPPSATDVQVSTTVAQNAPKSTETAPTATEPTNGAVSTDQFVTSEVKRLKNWALKQVGDIERTKEIWAVVMESYGLTPDQLPLKDSLPLIESDLSIAVGQALVGELVQPELTEAERPFV